MQKRTSIIPLFVLFVFIANKGYSQNQLNQLQSLDSIVIQNQRLQIPYSKQNRDIVVLDKAVIQSLPVHSVDALLSYVAGIDVKKRGVSGAQADIGINGGTFDQTLILLNGAKIIDPQTGHNVMNLPVSLDAIERIEILKGPAASAYGVNALNGAINIITRQPKNTGVMAHVYAGTSFKKDTANHQLYADKGVELSAGFATKNIDHFLSLTSIQSNGYRHNTALHNNKIFYSNKIRWGENSLRMMGGYVNNDFGANGFYSAPIDKESEEITETAITAIQGDIKISNHWTLRPGINYRYSFDDYILNSKHPEIYENKHYTNVVDANINNSFYTRIGTFGLGIEYRHTHIKSNSLGKHDRNNLGIYGNYNFDFIRDMSINLGIYGNYNNEFGWDWMPSIDAGYNLSKTFRLFASAGTGLRLPTYTDLYYKGAVNVGYAFLQPEKAWQTTAGIKYNGRKLHASVSYFKRNTNHLIDWVKDTLSNPWQSRNYHKMKTQGVSVEGDYRIISQKSAGYGLLAGISYTWLNPKLSESDKGETSWRYSHYAMENLRHQLTGRVNFKFLQYLSLTVAGKYQERVSYKDYFLLSVRLSADIQRFKVYFNADNLTNTQFIEAGSAPMPGSWFTLGVKWNWWKK